MTMIADAKRPDKGRFNLVVPVFNESEALPVLLNELDQVFAPATMKDYGLGDVQFIFVDDGSTDDTAIQIAEAITNGLPARLIRLSRNFGHQAAVTAGLDAADGDVVGIMDADLQDPPNEMLAMLQLWRDGYDVVYGVRRKRKENLLKRSAYYIFYRLIAFFTENLIPTDSGDFSVIDRRALNAIRSLPENLRFVRGIRAWVGFSQTPHEYERDARRAGVPKYTFRRLYRLATDGIISSSIRPLRLTQGLAILFFFLSLVIGVGSLILMIKHGHSDLLLTASLFLTAFCAVGFFLVFFCFYVISSYVGRSYLELKGRPPYIVMETIGGDTGEDDSARDVG